MNDQSALSETRPPAMSVLRRSTAEDHHRLEARSGLMSESLTLGRYGEILSAFAALHGPLDDLIARSLGNVPCDARGLVSELDHEGRRKLPSLLDDLLLLDIEPPRLDPHPFEVPLAWAIGAMYVGEGATLGGSVVAPHVTGLFGAGVPVTYFRSYGADVGRRWSVFRRVANALLISQDDVAVASSAACTVFASFTRAVAA